MRPDNPVIKCDEGGNEEGTEKGSAGAVKEERKEGGREGGGNLEREKTLQFN